MSVPERLGEIPKPNFTIIGSAKCGTTTLAKILADHPECCFSRPKEVGFFCSDENMAKGWNWYREYFSHYIGEPVIGEATPAYTDVILHPNTAKRMFAFNPDLKLIYIVRHPYERFVSGWRMFYRADKVNAREGIDAYFQASPRREADIKACCYHFQLSQYLKYFPKENIHIMFLEDLSQDLYKEMKSVCKFIGIDPEKLIIKNESGENKGDTYQYTDSSWKKLKKLGLPAVVKVFTPVSLRRKLFKSLFVKEVPTPRQELSSANLQEFWEIVSDDARIFLENNGKSADFWNLDLSHKSMLSVK